MVRGRGGVLGPDLSNVGRDRTPAQIEQALRDPGAAPASPAGRGGRGGRGGAILSGGDRPPARRPDAPRHREERKHVRPATARRGRQAAFAVERPNRGDRAREIADAEGRSDAGGDAQPGRVPQPPDDRPDAKATLATRRVGRRAFPSRMSRTPKPGTWPTYDGNLSGNRFSPLEPDQHRQCAASSRRSGCSRFPGAPRPLQVTPVVVDGVMYVTSVNEAYALDARSGREIWHYSRPRTQGLAGDAASGINRGVAVLGDRVFMVTDNAHLFALHRFTGQLLWDVEMADSHQNYGSTSAPLVVNDLVIAGVSGGDEGVRGFLDAYKASTGERVWRFWTIPAPGEPGSETWSGRAIEHGCGATWLTGTYDPGSAPALLAHRQSLPRLQRRRAQGRQPVHGVRGGARSGHREAEVALPVHAARPARLGRHRNAGAGGRDFPRRSRASCCCKAIATASSTCSTASPARCCWPSRSSRR